MARKRPYRTVLSGTCLSGGRHLDPDLALECPVVRKLNRALEAKIGATLSRKRHNKKRK